MSAGRVKDGVGNVKTDGRMAVKETKSAVDPDDPHHNKKKKKKRRKKKKKVVIAPRPSD